MNILLIGGCHSYGYGLTTSQRSFIDQFINRLEAGGQYTHLTSYVFLPLTKVRETLTQLNLSRFDLIIIQPANYYLQHPSSFWKLFKTPKEYPSIKSGFRPQPADLSQLRCQPVSLPDHKPAGKIKRSKSLLKRLLLRLSNPIGLVKQLDYVQRELAMLLEQLHVYRDKVFLVIPTPHLDLVSQWLRQQGRAIMLEEGNRHGMSILDTHLIVPAQEAFFLPDDPGHFNAIGHELLGRALFDGYQARQAAPGFFELMES